MLLTLDNLIDSVEDLPTLPQIVSDIIVITNDPDSTPQDIQKLLARDQALTAKILRLANSSYYGFARRIGTISEATILLGFQTIKSIVFAASVSNILEYDLDGYQLYENSLWKHSQATAIAARYIAKKKKFKNPELFYTAALVHDIGKIVLNNYLKEDYKKVLELVYEENLDFLSADEKVFGFNHAQVGAKLAAKWNLPPEIIDAIEYHHKPELASENRLLTATVHLADSISLMMGFSLGIDGLAYTISEKSLEILDLDEAMIISILPVLADMFIDKDSFDIF